MTTSATPEVAVFSPTSVTPTHSDAREGIRQLGLGYSFYNGLPAIITVVNRLGVRFEIAPNKSGEANTFLIRSIVELDRNVSVDTRDLLNDSGDRTTPEAEVVEKTIRNRSSSDFGRITNTRSLDYRLSLEDFHTNGGSIYISSLDLVFTLHTDHRVQHPYSVKGNRKKLEKVTYGLQTGRGVHYQIRIVDHHDSYGSKFVNLNGEVFKVVAEKLEGMMDGVYLLSSNPSKGRGGSGIPRSTYYSYEEAGEKLRLYSTYAEAKTLGNPEILVKAEDERRKAALKDQDFERETARREAEMERDRLKIELQRAEDSLKLKEQQFATLQHEYSVRELLNKRDNMIMKEKFDGTSTTRKEVLEMVKFVPAVLLGVGAIYTVVTKMKGK